MLETENLLSLLIALAVGLLIGTERGWHSRDAETGTRVAGIRTYGLIGLLGGIIALVSRQIGESIIGFTVVALAVVLSTAYVVGFRRDRDAGITSLIAGLLTYAFGALAVLGFEVAAGIGAVVTVMVLGFKPILHRWVKSLSTEELLAGLKLLLISVVLLPILPDRGFGPWQALNPYEIWWMVVLISVLSFVGYFAVKAAGASRGLLFAALFGGLASSTAVTLHFSRLGRTEAGMETLLATGILLACGTMFPRVLVITSVVNPDLLQPLILPMTAMAICTYGPAFFYWTNLSSSPRTAGTPLKNPLELYWALRFGALLALIMLLAAGLKAELGDTGIYWLAGVSGIADVDAIVLSVSHMSSGQLSLSVTVIAVVIASAANSVFKGVLATSIAGRALGTRVALPLIAASVAGVGILFAI